MKSRPNSRERLAVLLLVSAAAGAATARAADWPMWHRDPDRSGYTHERIPRSPGLLWAIDLPAPTPAWDGSQGRLRFDHHYEPIAYAGKLYVSSMARDRVTCHAASTGEELWRFYADGPVRLAAAAGEGGVYFSSDDGFLYCLSAETGALRWRVQGGPERRLLLGNGRLISAWPARGAPVLRDGTVYFAASIWPLMGVFVHAVDARDGGRVWTNSGMGSRFTVQQHSSPAFAGIAPQGYLAATRDHLIVPGGRTNPAVLRRSDGTLVNFNLDSRRMGTKGAGGYGVVTGDDFFLLEGGYYRIADGSFVAAVDASIHADGELIGMDDKGPSTFATQPVEVKSTDRRGRTTTSIEIPSYWRGPLEESIRRVFLVCGDRMICRGPGRTILGVDLPARSGAPELGWRVTLPDEPRSAIAADGRLFVATDAGRIYCFGETDSPAPMPPSRELRLIARGHRWHHRDGVDAPGADWNEPDVSVDHWPEGPGPLGFGIELVATTLSFGDDENNKPMTAYFRTTFRYDGHGASGLEALELRALVDDGAAFHLNGREVGRLFLPRGRLTARTAAREGTDSRSYYRLALRPDNLIPGENTLAVEVHQRDRGSSDLLFDLELIATPAPPGPRWEVVNDRWTDVAGRMLAAGVSRAGYCLALGLGSGRLATEIARQSDLHVVVVEPDRERVDAFRRRLDAAGAYGSRIAAVVGSIDELRLPAYFAELVISEDSGSTEFARDVDGVRQLYHCLRPFSGSALLELDESAHGELEGLVRAAKLDRASLTRENELTRLRRTAPPTGSANWTHQHANAANTAVSRDTVVKAPFQVLWFGGPSNAEVLPRHGHGPVPHVVGGRVFIQGRDMLRATDAYTGRLLWQRKLVDVGEYYDYTSHEPGANAIGSNYVSLPDAIYVVYRDRCLRLDPESGESVATFELPERPGAKRDWGYLAVRGDALVAGGSTTDFHTHEYSEFDLASLKGFALRWALGNVKRLVDFEPVTHEKALRLHPPRGGGEFLDEDDATPDSSDTAASSGRGGRFGLRMAVSDEEWQAHSEEEHRACLVANLNKLLFEEDMVAKIPEREQRFGGRRAGRDRPKTVEEISEKLLAYLAREESRPNDARALELKRDVLGQRYRLPAYRRPAPGKFGNVTRTGSRLLYVLDRHSGEIRWGHRAEHELRHGAIAVGRTAVFAIDRMTESEASYRRRRGENAEDGASVVALDLRSGDVLWRDTEHVFGTWLGCSDEHDVLLQAGAYGPDRSPEETRRGIVAYRATTGEVLWSTGRSYSGPCLLLGTRVITQGYQEPGFALDLLTGAPIRGPHPLSRQPVDWGYTRKYGCNTAIGSPNLLTFRSASAGYYDLVEDCGTSNLGGIRSGCTSNLIPAGGILSAPDYTRTCTCSYQNQVSAAFIHDPRGAAWSFSPHAPDGGPIRRLGLNLGAPGDRRAPDGTLWLDTPSVGGESPDVPVEFLPGEGGFELVSRHESAIDGVESWIGASAVRGEGKLVIHLDPPEELTIPPALDGGPQLLVRGAVLSPWGQPAPEEEVSERSSVAGGLISSRRFDASLAGHTGLASESVTVELLAQADGDVVFVDTGAARGERQGFAIEGGTPRVRYFVVALPEPDEEAGSGGNGGDRRDGGARRRRGGFGRRPRDRREIVIETTRALPRDRWARIAFTHDAATGVGRLFVDGELVGSHEGEAQPIKWNDERPKLTLGTRSSAAFRLAELRISKRPLAPGAFLGASEPADPETSADDVVAHWRMDRPVRRQGADASYRVRLIFAELDDAREGERTFDVMIQGERSLEAFDIAREARGVGRTVTREFPAVRAGTTLSLELRAIEGVPSLSGIELIRDDE